MSLAVLADETRPVYESISGGCAGFSEDDVGLSISLLEDIVVAPDVFAPWTIARSICIASVHTNTDTTSCVMAPKT